MSGLKKNSDWRQFERVRPRDNIDGEVKFILEAGDRAHRLVHLTDVSHFGAGLRIAEALENGASARLVMHVNDERYVVTGNVRWCRPEAEHGERGTALYHVGMSFDPNDMKSNMMFFAVLSRYCYLG